MSNGKYNGYLREGVRRMGAVAIFFFRMLIQCVPATGRPRLLVDQLTAMEIMAVDPLRYVAAPRFLGGVIAMPLLAAIFNIIGLFGAQLVGVQMMGIDRGSFWSQMQDSVEFRDVTEGVVKSLVFG